MLVVETQRANYLFACPSAAKKFAASERQWWIDHCPGIGTVPIRPVPLGPEHKFRVPNSSSTGAFSSEPIPLDALPSQLKCRRVQAIKLQGLRKEVRTSTSVKTIEIENLEIQGEPEKVGAEIRRLLQ